MPRKLKDSPKIIDGVLSNNKYKRLSSVPVEMKLARIES